MGLCMSGGGQIVDRQTVAMVDTPIGTESWKPVPHIEVIDAVTEDAFCNPEHHKIRIYPVCISLLLSCGIFGISDMVCHLSRRNIGNV